MSVTNKSSVPSCPSKFAPNQSGGQSVAKTWEKIGGSSKVKGTTMQEKSKPRSEGRVIGKGKGCY